jgi:putative spermidine/putrescine transport system ATP-binding protein
MDAPLSSAGGLQRSVAGRHLDVQHIWKAYAPGKFVVRDVSFTLHPGEFLSLLGPSGSGKTSTLMMVAGFETPSEGHIRVDGQDVANLPPERRNLGVVFQGYALFPHMSVLANVEFPLRMKRTGGRDRRRRALEMLDRVGLADFAARRPRELSGGQQQRVALARALVFEPDALLLDEPLSALDRRLREQLQQEIKELQRRVGISILYVTHDQDEAMMMSDRIAVMAEGEIAQIGPPSDVYLHPDSAFVASFLGETNLLPVVFQGVEQGRAVVRYADGEVGQARLPRSGAPPKPGDPAQVAIRPERLRLLDAGMAAEQERAGTVVSHTFMGRHIRSVIHSFGAPSGGVASFDTALVGQLLTVSSTSLPAASGMGEGVAVRLGWNIDDAQFLPGPRW